MTGESLNIDRSIELGEEPSFYSGVFKNKRDAALLANTKVEAILHEMGFTFRSSEEWKLVQEKGNLVIYSSEIQFQQKDKKANTFRKAVRLIFKPLETTSPESFILANIKFSDITWGKKIKNGVIKYAPKILLALTSVILVLSAVILLAPLLAKIGGLGLIGEGLTSTVNWVGGVTPDFIISIGSFFSNAVTGLAGNVIPISPEFSLMATMAATVFLSVGSVLAGIGGLAKIANAVNFQASHHDSELLTIESNKKPNMASHHGGHLLKKLDSPRLIESEDTQRTHSPVDDEDDPLLCTELKEEAETSNKKGPNSDMMISKALLNKPENIVDSSDDPLSSVTSSPGSTSASASSDDETPSPPSLIIDEPSIDLLPNPLVGAPRQPLSQPLHSQTGSPHNLFKRSRIEVDVRVPEGEYKVKYQSSYSCGSSDGLP
jgi:hypothetical protein